MLILKILSLIALLGSIMWFIFSPGFEPGLSVLGSLSAVITAYIIHKQKSKRAEQKQSVSKSSIGVQAGGDVNIGDIEGNKHAK
jgi:membrane associated rhomboid family serine protease